MAAYLIADVVVTDERGFEEYRQKVPAVVAAYGGRYHVRGGAVQRLEGDAQLHRVVVIEFADMAQLKAFFYSPEYRPLIAMRQKASRINVFGVEGL